MCVVNLPTMSQQQEQEQQQQLRQYRYTLTYPASSTIYQPMQQEYADGSNQYSLHQDFPTNSQNELQTGQLPQQYQSSLNLSQLPANVLGPPSYFISQLADEPLSYIDDSNLTLYKQLLPGSIQQQSDTLSTRQNLLTHRQQRQQRWLLQHPYSRQREVQTSNKSFTPMRPEHRLDRQNSVQSMRGVFPIEQSEYVQSQVCIFGLL